ncbi:unnamed protein product [Gordionus sp. m RMFG-2023]|uniref:tRNA-uridine aminocarboxypropyltransferase 1-like n=1 Tax=Gordionus sp. m RMFG-2023 TaxID=3053472 RepID=UPI0030E15EDB
MIEFFSPSPLHYDPTINPFINHNINSYTFLNNIENRSICSRCNKSRRFFCYTCYIPVESIKEQIPFIKLPLKIHIIKHPNELSGKSTAVHAALLAPNDVNIYNYPDFPKINAKNKTVLLYPTSDAFTLNDILASYSSINNVHDTEENAFQAIFIDGTWKQANKILRDERLQGLQHVKLNKYQTNFWRYQRRHKNDHLSTIEAIYYFVKEYQQYINNMGLNDLDVNLTKYDNLLFFYAFMHENIRNQYAGKKVIKAWKNQINNA